MIIKLLFELVLTILNFMFGWVNFPDMPPIITEALDIVMQAISMGIGFVWLIVPKELVLAAIPIIIVVENFDMMYSMVMWVLKKIPFLGMK